MELQNIASGKIVQPCYESSISKQFIFSHIEKIGNVPWRLSIGYSIANNIEYLALYVYCYDTNYSNLWSCNARVRLQLMRENGEHLTEIFVKCFTLNHSNWGAKFVRKDEFLEPDNGYLNVHDVFVVAAEIEVIDSLGFHKMGIIDFSIPQNIETGIVIRVGEQILHFDKFALMCFSPVFREMLTTENSKEIEIKDSDSTNFTTFLRVLNETQQITDFNVDNILTLAKRYDVQSLISNCEDFLISSKTLSISAKSQIAESHQLSGLQEFILDNVTMEELGKENFLMMMTIGAQTAKSLLVRICETKKRQKEIKEEEGPKLGCEPERRNLVFRFFRCVRLFLSHEI